MMPLIVASGIVSAAGAVPCIVGTVRGGTRPQAVSWGIWAVLMAIGGAAALASRQVPAAVYGLFCAGECMLVAVLALRYGGRAFSRLDAVCLGGAVTALAMLAVVRAPGPAIAVSVATEAIAYVPAVSHAWREPREETWSAYALYATGAGLALAAADLHVFAAVAYPAYLAAADAAVACMILARRGSPRPRRRGQPSCSAFPRLPDGDPGRPVTIDPSAPLRRPVS